jgi:hypothetical protein
MTPCSAKHEYGGINTRRRHNPDDDLNIHRRENLKSLGIS